MLRYAAAEREGTSPLSVSHSSRSCASLRSVYRSIARASFAVTNDELTRRYVAGRSMRYPRIGLSCRTQPLAAPTVAVGDGLEGALPPGGTVGDGDVDGEAL